MGRRNLSNLSKMSINLSESEKVFVVHGVGEDIRIDGRARRDVRPATSLETDIVTHASGSAHLRLANTDVLVGVKAELDTPLPETPQQGRIEFFVDCSANATPEFEGRGGQALADSLSTTLGFVRGHPDFGVWRQLGRRRLDGRQSGTLHNPRSKGERDCRGRRRARAGAQRRSYRRSEA